MVKLQVEHVSTVAEGVEQWCLHVYHHIYNFLNCFNPTITIIIVIVLLYQQRSFPGGFIVDSTQFQEGYEQI